MGQLASMRPRQSSLGIGVGVSVQRDSIPRFNEAEAIKPRNLVTPGSPSANIPASMRPRQSSLGILLGRRRRALPVRCFNEAEAIKPRNRASPHAPCAGTSGFNEAEAIKPRNPARRRREIAALDAASMRPRQSSLGINLTPAQTSLATSLQ